MSDRFYLRGTSALGLLNTMLACLFNRVLVRWDDSITGETVNWEWAKATDYPQAKE